MLEEFRELIEDHDRETLPNVLFVAAECAPLAKTGGLADVVGTLPKTLRPLGIEARVMIPYHRIIKEKYRDQVEHLFHFYVDLGWRHEYAGIEKLTVNDTVVYLVDSEMYFGGPIYRGGMAEIEQYAFFVRAVLEAMPKLDFVPEIVHCNDWHTGMIPMLARTQYRGRMQEKMKYLISIHNIAFQGWCGFDMCSDLLGVDPAYYTPEFIELNGCADFLKAGCVFSDRINTVSPTYAEEIKTAYYGEGLQGILNARSAQLWGILNGIDTDAFDPEKEKNLPANFSVNDLAGKSVCKKALQEKMGLDPVPDVPILSMVMRMTEQKGFELVMEQLDDMMQNENLQFVLLGSGDARYEEFMRGAQARYPGRLGIYLGYNEELAHLIYAGSDLFLMPSRFEPCGLSQMIAMRYGCLPIVRETGGLKDSVIPYNCYDDTGDGFSFTEFNSHDMRMVIHYAVQIYQDKKALSGLIRRAMEKDFSFERSAKEYVRLYIDMLDGYHETLPVLSHDCRAEKYRKPFGAVPCGEKVTLRFDVVTGKVKNAALIVRGECLENGKTELRMRKGKNSFSAVFTTPETPCALRYDFCVETKYGDRYFCADRTGLSGILCGDEGEGFGLTVYSPDLETPEWFRRSIIYQIFPDRFGFSGKTAVRKGIEYHQALGQKISLHKSLSEPVKWEPEEGEEFYQPNDFYGGTLKGIREKLPYLKELGISCICLNPVMEAPSNHRFDPTDVQKVDPILGTEKNFISLCKEAKKYGIRVLLDGVFSGDKNAEEEIATWMERGVSGWKICAADRMTDAQRTEIRDRIKGKNPDAPVIAEMWEECIPENGYDSVTNYPLRFALADFLTGRRNAWSLAEFLTLQQMNSPRPIYYSMVNLLSSHNVARIRTELASACNLQDMSREKLTGMVFPEDALNKALQREKLAAVIQFTVPGVPCIYYGDEQGMTGACDPLNRGPFTEAESQELFRFYADLAEKRNTSEAILSGEAIFLALSDDVIAILRWIPDGNAVCAIINRGENAEKYSIDGRTMGFGRIKGKIAPESAEFIFP